MIRSILAVTAGYAVMVAVVVAIFPFVLGGLGEQPAALVALLLLTGFGAAVAGGFVARWAAGPQAPRRGMMVVLGLFAGLAAAAATAGQEPFLLQILHPLTMGAGAPLGAWLRMRLTRATSPQA